MTSDLPKKFLIELAATTSSHFTIVLDEISVMASGDAVPKDVYRRFDFVIDELKTGLVVERLLARALSYIKQHVSRLRHQNIPIIRKNIDLVIESFNDAIVALREIVVKKFLIWGLLKAIEMMALSYYQVCLDTQIHVTRLEIYSDDFPHLEIEHSNLRTELRLLSEEAEEFEEEPRSIDHPENVPLQLDSLTSTEHSLPKEMTMRWYKIHKWYDFFIGRTIVFLKGAYRDQPCMVISFNGGGTRCRFSDGSYHCISVDIPLTWSD